MAVTITLSITNHKPAIGLPLKTVDIHLPDMRRLSVLFVNIALPDVLKPNVVYT